MSPYLRAGFACLLCSSVSLTARGEAPFWPAEVAAPSSRRVKFDSAVNGESHTLNGEGHASGVPAALARGMQFAFVED
jgi:hypothetical protein